jgi:hypothetical protein
LNNGGTTQQIGCQIRNKEPPNHRRTPGFPPALYSTSLLQDRAPWAFPRCNRIKCRTAGTSPRGSMLWQVIRLKKEKKQIDCKKTRRPNLYVATKSKPIVLMMMISEVTYRTAFFAIESCMAREDRWTILHRWCDTRWHSVGNSEFRFCTGLAWIVLERCRHGDD